MASWTTDDMPDQHGRVVVITGANAGLGLESATQLARRGAEVVMACRNEQKAADAQRQVAAVATGPAPSVVKLDLADLDSVEAAAREIAGRWPTVDVLMNNAGLMAIPERQETPQGHEMQFGVNHLAHFALTLRLMPQLLSADAPRVVALGSVAHRVGRIRLGDLDWTTKKYDAWQVYGQTKLATILFAHELDRRAKRAGLALRGVAAHPGYSATNLQSTGPLDGGRGAAKAVTWAMAHVLTPLVGQPARMGALGQLRGATDPSVQGGEYFGPTFLFGMRGAPNHSPLSSAGKDATVAAKLWDESEQMTGLTFDDAVAAATS